MENRSLEILVPPVAPVLLESMRAIGYSFEAALADIVDNSISAEADTVNIRFSPYSDPYVAVLDDGRGMTDVELIEAMRHGSRDPRLPRSQGDLGRFGLGLKTASLSQCRCLTVISLKEANISARRWDLDLVEKRGDWVLTGLAQQELKKLPLVEDLRKQKSGTLVLWHNFDRICAGESSIETALGDRMDHARDHLAMVFHRLIRPEKPGSSLKLCINNNPIPPVDPFLSNHKATQPLPDEKLIVEGEPIVVSPFILPHLSKLSPEDLQTAGGEDGLRRNQGFYVYRNRRLISWGSWFRMVRQEELTKLARVRVDIPNSLDHLWTLDVKKSSAFPPEPIRNGLKVIVGRIAEGSRRVYKYRGQRANSDDVVHAWDRRAVRGGVIYSVNRDHPVVTAIASVIPDQHLALLDKLLQTVETSFPFDALYADMASEKRPDVPEAAEGVKESLYDLATRILDAFGADQEAKARFLNGLESIEPFSRYGDVTRELMSRLTSKGLDNVD